MREKEKEGGERERERERERNIEMPGCWEAPKRDRPHDVANVFDRQTIIRHLSSLRLLLSLLLFPSHPSGSRTRERGSRNLPVWSMRARRERKDEGGRECAALRFAATARSRFWKQPPAEDVAEVLTLTRHPRVLMREALKGRD